MGAQTILILEHMYKDSRYLGLLSLRILTQGSASAAAFFSVRFRIFGSVPDQRGNPTGSHTLVPTHPPPQTSSSACCDHPVTSNTERQGLLLVKDSRGFFCLFNDILESYRFQEEVLGHVSGLRLLTQLRGHSWTAPSSPGYTWQCFPSAAREWKQPSGDISTRKETFK